MHVPMMCAIDDGLVPLTALQKFPPSLDQIIHEGSLSDIIHLIPMCSFWNENKTKMKPIVHLLCKVYNGARYVICARSLPIIVRVTTRCMCFYCNR